MEMEGENKAADAARGAPLWFAQTGGMFSTGSVGCHCLWKPAVMTVGDDCFVGAPLGALGVTAASE